MKTMFCPLCGRTREVEDNIVIVVCPACLEEMKLKYNGLEKKEYKINKEVKK